MNFALDGIPNLEILSLDTLSPSLETAVKTLQLEGFEWFYTVSPEEESIQEDKFFNQPDRIKYLLALQEEELIGMVIVLKRQILFQDKPLILGGLGGVTTAKRWRRKGIASRLISVGMEELKKSGCDIAYLCTDIEQPATVRLYQKFGFEVLNRPHTFLGKSGKRYMETDGMIAPINSLQVFELVKANTEPFDIGRSNW